MKPSNLRSTSDFEITKFYSNVNGTDCCQPRSRCNVLIHPHVPVRIRGGQVFTFAHGEVAKYCASQNAKKNKQNAMLSVKSGWT